MRYVYAALLLHASGTKIKEDTLTTVLAATGTDVDPARVKALVAAPEAESKKEDAPVDEEEEEKKEEEALAGLGALFG
jgi:large subunit ribosomal protein L12